MRRIKMVVLVALGLAMCGCSVVDTEPSGPIATFTVTVASSTKIVVDASASRADEYTWDFGDGTPVISGGPEIMVMSYTYAETGVYAVKLVVRWLNGEGGGGGDSGGCCGPGPGPGDAPIGTTTNTIGSAVRIVNLTHGYELRPWITMISFTGGIASEEQGFLPWTKATFTAEGSYSPTTPLSECVIRWEIHVFVPVGSIDPETGKMRWDVAPRLEYEYYGEGITYTISQIPGPGGCDSPPAAGIVTLSIWDAYGNHAKTERDFFVGYP